MKIENIELESLFPAEIILKKNFEYAGVLGTAELIGWQINCFRANSDLSSIAAICLEDITDSEELERMANEILNTIQFPIQIGDNVTQIFATFGNAKFKDEIIEGISRYGYILDKGNLFFCLGVDHNDKVCSVEIVQNVAIINARLNYQS